MRWFMPVCIAPSVQCVDPLAARFDGTFNLTMTAADRPITVKLQETAVVFDGGGNHPLHVRVRPTIFSTGSPSAIPTSPCSRAKRN
jgi:hypothetical protein